MKYKILVAFLVILSGCSGINTVQDDLTTTSGETDIGQTEKTETKTDERKCGTDTIPEPTPREPPQKPEELTKEQAVKFAEEYEKYRLERMWIYQGRWGIQLSPTANITNITDGGYLISIETAASYKTCVDNTIVHGDAPIQANYFIDETDVFLLENPNSTESDPRTKGTAIDG